jgi:hypothetical protein
MISTDCASLQLQHESIYTELNNQFISILTETNQHYDKLLLENKSEAMSKINE